MQPTSLARGRDDDADIVDDEEFLTLDDQFDEAENLDLKEAVPHAPVPSARNLLAKYALARPHKQPASRSAAHHCREWPQHSVHRQETWKVPTSSCRGQSTLQYVCISSGLASLIGLWQSGSFVVGRGAEEVERLSNAAFGGGDAAHGHDAAAAQPGGTSIAMEINFDAVETADNDDDPDEELDTAAWDAPHDAAEHDVDGQKMPSPVFDLHHEEPDSPQPNLWATLDAADDSMCARDKAPMRGKTFGSFSTSEAKMVAAAGLRSNGSTAATASAGISQLTSVLPSCGLTTLSPTTSAAPYFAELTHLHAYEKRRQAKLRCVVRERRPAERIAEHGAMPEGIEQDSDEEEFGVDAQVWGSEYNADGADVENVQQSLVGAFDAAMGPDATEAVDRSQSYEELCKLHIVCSMTDCNPYVSCFVFACARSVATCWAPSSWRTTPCWLSECWRGRSASFRFWRNRIVGMHSIFTSMARASCSILQQRSTACGAIPRTTQTTPVEWDDHLQL